MRRLGPSPNSSSFECCDRNPEPACTTLMPPQRLGLDAHARADGVAVARGAGQAATAIADLGAAIVVAEHAQLRRLPRGHHREVGVAVADRRRTRRTTGRPGRGRGPPAPETSSKPPRPSLRSSTLRWWLAIELVDQQLVDRPPRVVVRRALDARERRARDDLPPEEAVEVAAARPRASACRWRRRGPPSRRCRSRARRTTTPSGPSRREPRASCPRSVPSPRLRKSELPRAWRR